MRLYDFIVAGVMSLVLISGICVSGISVSEIGARENAMTSGNQTNPPNTVYHSYAELLDRHLVEMDLEKDGLVSAFDYAGALARDDTMDLLNAQREALAAFDTDLIDTREKGNAFWLNAYNFFMIAHILQERPDDTPDDTLVASVWDYGGRYNPFRKNVFELEIFAVDGRSYSLDQMQKTILLGKGYLNQDWAEARTHFAVNCASVGCPPLRSEIYTPDNVDAFLTENTRRALNTNRHLHVKGSTLYISSIFDWYADDFKREEGSVREFIRKYADERGIEEMAQTDQIRFIDYDWSLNKPANFPEFNSGRP